jgi:ligand-binding SRPBCC domain-containing protein
MKIYNLHKEQYLPITIEKAWDFFSSAKNLSKITPPEMKFVVLTALTDDPVYSGMKIDYTVRPLLNIPLHWTTEIIKVDAPRQFIDTQKKGPYSLWEHTHTFKSVPGGVKMTDDVKYALPLGFLGNIAHALVVNKKLQDIFNFREKTLVNLFGLYKQ